MTHWGYDITRIIPLNLIESKIIEYRQLISTDQSKILKIWIWIYDRLEAWRPVKTILISVDIIRHNLAHFSSGNLKWILLWKPYFSTTLFALTKAFTVFKLIKLYCYILIEKYHVWIFSILTYSYRYIYRYDHLLWASVWLNGFIFCFANISIGTGGDVFYLSFVSHNCTWSVSFWS